MSTLKVNNINNVAGDTTVSLSGGSLVATDVKTSSINSGPIGGFRNRIINGAMEIDQRNAGASVTLNNNGTYINDRWIASATGGSGTGTATAQRVADAPSGFTYSLKYTVTNAKTPASADSFYIYQPIEGQNITDFAYGTASAKSVTLSFWVKSSLTGTFSGFLRSYNGTSYRSYVFNYTINAANTWQYVTITAIGDTGQVPSSDNTQGYAILFDLGSGSNSQTSTLNSWQTGGSFYRSTTSINLISTLNATFQITGVQLELGTQATPFERRSYGAELALCQRYFLSDRGGGGMYWGNGTATAVVNFREVMRITPTVTLTSVRYGYPSASTSSWAASDISTGGFRLEYTGGGQNLFADVNFTSVAEL